MDDLEIMKIFASATVFIKTVPERVNRVPPCRRYSGPRRRPSRSPCSTWHPTKEVQRDDEVSAGPRQRSQWGKRLNASVMCSSNVAHRARFFA